MSEMPGPFPKLVGCVCFDVERVGACVCDRTEMLLRAHLSPTWHPPALTEEQRAWCVDQIRSVEGHGDYQPRGGDAVLAIDVLNAWRDFARDKGIY